MFDSRREVKMQKPESFCLSHKLSYFSWFWLGVLKAKTFLEFFCVLIYVKSVFVLAPSAFVLHDPVVLSKAQGTLVQWLRSFVDKTRQSLALIYDTHDSMHL